MEKAYTLLIENSNISYDLNNSNSRKISVGRKDLSVTPDIDLGPYDEGPYISRIQGYFFIEEDNLFFEDKSKNGSLINNRLLKDQKIALVNKDKLRFGNIYCEVIIE